jgi:hypothetical protein
MVLAVILLSIMIMMMNVRELLAAVRVRFAMELVRVIFWLRVSNWHVLVHVRVAMGAVIGARTLQFIHKTLRAIIYAILPVRSAMVPDRVATRQMVRIIFHSARDLLELVPIPLAMGLVRAIIWQMDRKALVLLVSNAMGQFINAAIWLLILRMPLVQIYALPHAKSAAELEHVQIRTVGLIYLVSALMFAMEVVRVRATMDMPVPPLRIVSLVYARMEFAAIKAALLRVLFAIKAIGIYWWILGLRAEARRSHIIGVEL